MANMIEMIGLTKYYRHGLIGIDDLSITVEEGEIYGFLGSNGAGKTTTIRLLVNLLFPTRGRAFIFGRDVVKDHGEISRHIGYIPGMVSPYKHMTGREYLLYMSRLSGDNDHDYRQYLLNKFDLSPKDLERKIKEYSTGMARKISLVQAFQHRPRLLIMDEPTEGLDPLMQHSFYELLKDFRGDGGTVFISSHHLLEVQQVCDRAAIIRQGRLVSVEKIDGLLNRINRQVEVRFKDKIDLARLVMSDWQIISLDENYLKAKITGRIDKIIKLLSHFEIEDISIPDPSLQDVFLDYYQQPEKGQ